LSYIWDKDTHLKRLEERNLVGKLDLSILIIACVGGFIKFLDQTNIDNAYVSGMKQDLAMNGNEYTYAGTAYTVGYAVIQIPSTLIAQKVPPCIWLTAAEAGWGIFTFAQAGLRNLPQIYAFRFLVGIFESSFSPLKVYVMGSWYTHADLAKRITIFRRHLLGLPPGRRIQQPRRRPRHRRLAFAVHHLWLHDRAHGHRHLLLLLGRALHHHGLVLDRGGEGAGGGPRT
jgi:hypothetical protein